MSRLLVLLALLVVFLPNAHSASLPIRWILRLLSALKLSTHDMIYQKRLISKQMSFSAELAEDGVLELEIDLAGILQPPKMSDFQNF